jgi:hypothetical protein
MNQPKEEAMRRLSIAALLATVVLMGCSGEKKQNEQPPAQVRADSMMGQQNNNTQPTPSQEPPARPRENTPSPRPAEPTMVTRTAAIGPGTELPATLDEKISTESAHAGDGFTLTLADGYTRNGVTLLPAGTKIRGDVTRSKRAARVGGKAELSMQFKEVVTPNGEAMAILSDPVMMEGKSTTKGDVEKIAGSTVGGAIIGGILGGKSGAIKGGAAGAAGGTVWAVVTRGSDIVLDSGTPVHVTLRRELQVPVTIRSDQPIP